MNWNEFAAEVHQVAVDHGWWEEPPGIAEIVVMCHAELSEAVEEYRAGRPMVYCGEGMAANAACREGPCGGLECLRRFPGRKPQGIAVGLADCVLRILDYLASIDFDIDAKMGYRPASTDFMLMIADRHADLSAVFWRVGPFLFDPPVARDEIAPGLVMCIGRILGWASQKCVDMEAVLQLKHEYNKKRPYRHGGKKL